MIYDLFCVPTEKKFEKKKTNEEFSKHCHNQKWKKQSTEYVYNMVHLKGKYHLYFLRTPGRSHKQPAMISYKDTN